MKRIHLDLFSGIGGFALAVDEVWPGSEHIFCEIDKYCQTLLKKRFEGAQIYGDIRQLTADTEYTRELQSQRGIQKEREWSCNLLTGGFPCQPFSQAGKRKGADDNRYLWPEMLRVIRDFQPAWVVAENVRGLLTINEGLVFEQVCLDLEGEGYEVQPFVIPAVAKNAPHRRDRVWFVAHFNSAGLQGLPETQNIEIRREIAKQRPGINPCWETNWLEVATELCGVDDGLPAELDGLKLSKSRHRVERLKALGNAIVPGVAVEIMKAIQQAERNYETHTS